MTRLLYVVNVDWFFLSHRLPLARAAQAAGCHVTVAACDTGFASRIVAEGFSFESLTIERSGRNPAKELASLIALLRLYHRVAPHLVHHVTIKPVLYGSIAARVVGNVAVVNAVTGLGYLFVGGRRGVTTPIARSLYKVALNAPNTLTIFQNGDDRDELTRSGLVDEERTRLIRGSGVDCSQFVSREEPAGAETIMLAARMLYDKGVDVFVQAARNVLRQRPRVRFVLVGAADPANPSAVDESVLRAWVAEGVVEWWGHVDDMVDALGRAHIVVLPSRREGLPKVLLEAAATGRPVVSTDVPGCREVVQHGITGLLVPDGDHNALAAAIISLIDSPSLRLAYGAAGRRLVEREFTEAVVVDRTLTVYRELLGNRWPDT